MRFKIILLFLSLLISIPSKAQYSFNVKRSYGETGHQIYSVSYSREGDYIVSIGYDNSIIIWNAESGIIYRTLGGLKKRPLAAVISIAKDLCASGGEDNMITLWDLKTANVITTLAGIKGNIKALDISTDGKYLAAGGSDRIIRIWDTDSKNLVFELKRHKSDVNALQFSADGKMLVSVGGDKMLCLWNLQSGNIINSKEAHKNWISDVEFSADGKYIASCGFDNLIEINSVPDLKSVNTLQGHKDWIQTIAFSPDGKYLLSGARDQLIILWDVMSGKILSQSEKQGQYVLSVDFCPSRPDFISSTLMSEKLDRWALSGLQYSIPQAGTTSGGSGTAIQAAQKVNIVSPEEEIITYPEKKVTMDENSTASSMIELYSPVPANGKIIIDKPTVFIIGRVHDQEGISVLLINKDPVKISEAGIFESEMNLTKGENLVSIVAINKKGKMNEKVLKIDCIAETLPASSGESSIPPGGNFYALLIGINDYQSPEINDLDNPIKDAERLYEVLHSKYTFREENIIFLRNPTLTEIISTLDKLAMKLNINDNLLIFYAGHGYWDEKSRLGYWFPSDATKNSTVKWFRNSTLRDFIGSIRTKHTLLIADACFSGAIFKTRAAFNDASQGIKKLDELPSRKAMTSGILQEVPDESIFIEYLVKRLSENEERYLPSELLFSSFKTAVMDNSTNVPQFGVIQNVGDEGGDFIFMLK
ncbi:MAG: caspase family protein [Bacteroidales bacterium]|nr:caspase family protein [Bacteroidales bacterium]